MGLVALTDGIVLGAAAVGFMAAINLRLTLFVLIPMPMIIFCTRLLSRKMHRLYQETQATFADMTEVVRERIAGRTVTPDRRCWQSAESWTGFAFGRQFVPVAARQNLLLKLLHAADFDLEAAQRGVALRGEHDPRRAWVAVNRAARQIRESVQALEA